jgi:hypothetical protein
MKVVKNFNNISEELKKTIPTLKHGEIKTFLMLNGVPNPDPDPKEQSKDPILYGKKQIRTNFRIYDQYLKNSDGEKVGGYVDVGAVERWDGDKPERFVMLVPGMTDGSRFQGKFSLTGGKQYDTELFEVLWLSPEREDSPCPENGTAPLFKLLDFKADAKKSNSRFDTLKKAIDYADAIKADKAAEVMAALNQPTIKDHEILLAKVKELARTQPEEFIKTYESEETPIKSIIRAAMDAGILSHDPLTGEVKMGAVKLTILRLETAEAFVPNFVKWVNTADNGKNVLNNIKSQLEKAKS